MRNHVTVQTNLCSKCADRMREQTLSYWDRAHNSEGI